MVRCIVCFALLGVTPLSGVTFIPGTITAGTIDLVSTGQSAATQQATFSLSGPDFTFSGTGTVMNPVFSCDRAGISSSVTLCGPGESIDPAAGDVASSFGPITGTFMFQGSSENYATASGAVVQLSQFLNLTTPTPVPLSGPLTENVAISGPIRGVAVFIDPNFAPGAIFNFTGQGTATAHLIAHHFFDPQGEEFGNFYVLTSIHVDYSTPEPRTFALAGMALACWGIKSLVRRRKQH